MKKLVSILLAMMLAIVFCSTALAYSKEEPITIQFWHNRGSGVTHEVMKDSVDKFNATVGAEKGIIVQETYMGGYPDIVSKLQLASQTNELPTVSVCAGDYISALLDDDLLEDMAPFIESTGFDLSNIFEDILNVPGNEDGQVHSLPYIKSTPLFYYNKTLADEKGLSAPVTVEDMEAFCKELHTVNAASGEVETWGFAMYNNISYILGNFLWQLGEPFIGPNGTAPCLDGSLLKVLTDWDRWVTEGWCRPFDSTNATSVMMEMFYQGKLAAYVNSCSIVGTLTNGMKEHGYELGVAGFPTYNEEEPYSVIGGGELVLISRDNTPEQHQAGWEFITFLMQDEQLYDNAIRTGYLPFTKSIVNNPEMAAFWEANPQFKVAYDQLQCAVVESYPYFEGRAEFRQNCQGVISTLIQERSITPEQAVQQIKDDNAHLFK